MAMPNNFNSPGSIVITPQQLFPLLGLPQAPVILDVRIEADIALDPQLVPGAKLIAHTQIESLISQWSGNGLSRFRHRPVLVYCQKGGKLSQGAAAILRHHGYEAYSLAGGQFAWRDLGFPLMPITSLRQVKAQVTSYWVAVARPDLNTLASIWLLRRFIDPHAVLLFVEAAEVAAVAEKFSGAALSSSAFMQTGQNESDTFAGLINLLDLRFPALTYMSNSMSRMKQGLEGDPGGLPGLAELVVGLQNLRSDDLALAEACLPLFDACYQWSLAKVAGGSCHE